MGKCIEESTKIYKSKGCGADKLKRLERKVKCCHVKVCLQYSLLTSNVLCLLFQSGLGRQHMTRDILTRDSPTLGSPTLSRSPSACSANTVCPASRPGRINTTLTPRLRVRPAC